MGHDDLDRRIKQKLEARRMTPSAGAWDKLEKDLEEVSNTRRKKNILPYWVAASVVALLAVGVWFFKGSETGDIQGVTDVQIDIEPRKQEKPIKVVEQDTEAHVEVKIPIVRPEENTTTPLVKSSEAGRTVSFPDTAEEEGSEPPEVARNQEEAIAFEDKKVGEVVSRIMEIREKREVTDEEIERLLAEAQREINSQHVLAIQTGKVDAMALLDEVETELDKSFRDKVFEALKDGFEKVRTAVANNNQ